jgi:hypothetical protein
MYPVFPAPEMMVDVLKYSSRFTGVGGACACAAAATAREDDAMKPVTAERLLLDRARDVSDTATKQFSELFQITRKTKFNEGRCITTHSEVNCD